MTVQTDRNFLLPIVRESFPYSLSSFLNYSLSSILYLLFVILLVSCDNDGPETITGDKIADNEIKGTWIKVSGNSMTDTAFLLKRSWKHQELRLSEAVTKLKTGGLSLQMR